MADSNLKRVLMDVGNRLVTEHGFDPALPGHRTTKPIKDFTDWLNATPEAREILYEMGFDWPIVSKPR